MIKNWAARGLMLVTLTGCSINSFSSVPVLENTEHKPNNNIIRIATFTPKGNGPFPTVFLLQGCDGFAITSWQHLTFYADHFNNQGYAAVIIDSFSPRNVTQVCENSSLVTAKTQAEDAYSVLHYFKNSEVINSNKIAVFGASHGGWAVLSTNSFRSVSDEKFVGGVAIYPGCKVDVTEKTQFPLLLLAAKDDDWAFASICETYVNKAMKYNSQIEFKIYEHTTHDWDVQISPRIVYGHYLAPNSQTTEDSMNRIDEFLNNLFR